MNTLLVTARAVHFASSIVLLGGFGFELFVLGPALRDSKLEMTPDARALRRRLTSAAAWSLLAALASALVWFVAEAASMSGESPAKAMNYDTLRLVLSATAFGRLWLFRLLVAAVLALLLWTTIRFQSTQRHPALVLTAFALAAAYLMSIAWSGHAAAAADAQRRIQLTSDAIHLLAAGAWLGALAPLVFVLGVGSRLALAAHVAQRFSTLGVASVSALLVTGVVNAWFLVGSVPTLLGTDYGRLLLAKLLLFAAMLSLAAVNRFALAPRLAEVSMSALATLRRNACFEIVAGVGVVIVVALLGITIPGAHDTPVWPFSHTLAWPSSEASLAVHVAILASEIIGCAGAVILGAALLRRRLALSFGGVALIGIAIGISGWTLSTPAYPTTYATPSVPYATASLARGASSYAEKCAACHGELGHGDGSAATSLSMKPADLTEHTAHHYPGELYWWIAHGIPNTPMPGFANELDSTDLWSVVRYLRVLADAATAREAADGADFHRWILAPDFTFETKTHGQESLTEQRAKSSVLLVLYTPLRSSERLRDLETERQAFTDAGVRIVVAPPGPRSDINAGTMDGSEASVLAVTGTDTGKIYAMYAQAPQPGAGSVVHHAELLIDRQGYLRALWRGIPKNSTRQTKSILAQAQSLDREPPRPEPMEHMH